METWKHVQTAGQLFSTSVIRYLVAGAAVAYGSLFTFGFSRKLVSRYNEKTPGEPVGENEGGRET